MKTLTFLIVTVLTYTSLLAQDSLSHYSLTELNQRFENAANAEVQLDYALAMLPKAEQAFSTQDTSFAQVNYKLGKAFFNNRAFVQSEKYLLNAADIQSKTIPKHEDYASTLFLLGKLYDMTGRSSDAEQYLSQALSIREPILDKTHPDYIANVSYLGYVLADIQDGARAEKYLLQGLELKQAIYTENPIRYAQDIYYLGMVSRLIGNYEQAEQYYLQALDIVEATLGKENYQYGLILDGLAVVQHAQKNNGKAKQLYLEALAITKVTLGDQSISYAQSLNNLAAIYTEEKEYTQAETYYFEALSIYKKTHGEQHFSYVNTLNNLGFLYGLMKQYEKSEAFYAKAVAIRKEILGTTHPLYVSALNNLATTYFESKNYDQAWEQTRLAIQANSGIDIGSFFSVELSNQLVEAECVSLQRMNNSLGLLGNILEKRGTAEAKAQQILVIDLALQFCERWKNELNDDNDKLRILEEKSDWVLASMRTLNLEIEQENAFNIAEQEKGILLLDVATNKQVYTKNLLPDTLIQQEKELQKAYTNTQAALSQKRSNQEIDSIRNELNILNNEIASFRQRINNDYPKYAAMRYNHKSVQAAEIQQSLTQDEALIEYLIGDSITYIFYIDKTVINIHSFNIHKDTLQQHIYQLHKALSDYQLIKKNKQLAFDLYTEQAYWHYQHLLAPILEDKHHIKKLIVIPDGELGHLPFETFLVEPTAENNDYSQLHYLIQDYAISYNYSATLWHQNMNQATTANNHQIFGVASNYDIQYDSSSNTNRLPVDTRMRNILTSLPSARQEVEQLSTLYDGFFVFDSSATEQTFKDNAAQYAIIHLAMHGLLNSRDQLLSSLAFTEDSDSTENNFLHAYEIMKMELNADLVVLSACETGLGKFEEGNGIASLARSFMYAGVPAMVVSLWEVNDVSTQELMQLFYTHLADGYDKDISLRQAKLDYLQTVKGDAAHPAYWSPFVMMGNTNPTNIKRKGMGAIVWWIGGGLLVVVLGRMFIRRRKVS